MSQGKITARCPKCGATKYHWKHKWLLSDAKADWDADEPSEANPDEGYRCPHCGVAIVDYARYERDLDEGYVTLYSYVPKHCMECGEELGL